MAVQRGVTDRKAVSGYSRWEHRRPDLPMAGNTATLQGGKNETNPSPTLNVIRGGGRSPRPEEGRSNGVPETAETWPHSQDTLQLPLPRPQAEL